MLRKVLEATWASTLLGDPGSEVISITVNASSVDQSCSGVVPLNINVQENNLPTENSAGKDRVELALEELDIVGERGLCEARR